MAILRSILRPKKEAIVHDREIRVKKNILLENYNYDATFFIYVYIFLCKHPHFEIKWKFFFYVSHVAHKPYVSFLFRFALYIYPFVSAT